MRQPIRSKPSVEAVATGHALRAQALSIRFGGTLVLTEFELATANSEIHGLVSDDGSEKCNLIKMPSGVHQPPGRICRNHRQSAGIRLAGEHVRPRVPHSASGSRSIDLVVGSRRNPVDLWLLDEAGTALRRKDHMRTPPRSWRGLESALDAGWAHLHPPSRLRSRSRKAMRSSSRPK